MVFDRYQRPSSLRVQTRSPCTTTSSFITRRPEERRRRTDRERNRDGRVAETTARDATPCPRPRTGGGDTGTRRVVERTRVVVVERTRVVVGPTTSGRRRRRRRRFLTRAENVASHVRRRRYDNRVTTETTTSVATRQPGGGLVPTRHSAHAGRTVELSSRSERARVAGRLRHRTRLTVQIRHGGQGGAEFADHRGTARDQQDGVHRPGRGHQQRRRQHAA